MVVVNDGRMEVVRNPPDRASFLDLDELVAGLLMKARVE